MNQTDKLLDELSNKIDKILRLLAIIAVKEIETEQDKIGLLDSLGFRATEIAKLLNKSPENVSVQLGIIRKKKESKPKAKATDQTQTSEESGKDRMNIVRGKSNV
jgi:hypothetical protein